MSGEPEVKKLNIGGDTFKSPLFFKKIVRARKSFAAARIAPAA